MSITRMALRQEIGDDLDEGYAGTITSFLTTTEFVDSNLIDSGESEHRWEGAWVIFTSGTLNGTERRVEAFDSGAGKITLGRAVTIPSPGGTFELHTLMSPADMNTCMNRALARCTYEVEQGITPVAGQLQYDLKAYEGITDPGQLRRVYWREGNTANKYTYTSLPFKVFNNAGYLTLHLNPFSFSAGSSAMIIINYKAPYPAFVNDTDIRECPVEWAKAGACLQMYDMLLGRGTAQDASRLERRRNEYAARFSQLTRAYAPRKIVHFGLENDDVRIFT